MTRPSKRKIQIKKQKRSDNGRFIKKSRLTDDSRDNDNWGDDDDSGWDYEIDYLDDKAAYDQVKEKPLELVWSDNAHLETNKRGPYLTGEIKKSTYFDKYGPSGSFTKAAKGTVKITNYLNKSTLDDFTKIVDDTKDEEWNQLVLKEKIENLKIELQKQHKVLTVTEYNKKRAIFEYLRRLDENGRGKAKASKEAAELVYIEHAPFKARSIQYWANYWLQYNHLPVSRQGKHQKTIRLIDDEDVAEECYSWIRSQGGTTTPLKFKEFIEQKLLINTGITKKKTISMATSARWLNVLGFSFQQQKQGKNFH